MFTDLEKLHAWLTSQTSDPPLVVGIEGASESGKTTLANYLTTRPREHVVHTDDSCTDGFRGDEYVDGLKLKELEEEFGNIPSDSDRIVIEGICLRDTLAKIDTKRTVSLFIYCKRYKHGYWLDDPAEWPSALGTIDEMHREEFGNVVDTENMSRSTGAFVDWWCRKYHGRVCPHLLADIIYRWTKS